MYVTFLSDLARFHSTNADTMSNKHRILLLITLTSILFLAASVSFAVSAKTTNVPHPFFFTENKGQWDTCVLYKCNARNGMTWFLERDGVTLLTCVEDKTQPALPDPGSADLPVCMQKHPARYPMESHALKFKFLVASLQSPVASNKQSATVQDIEASGELAWHNNYFLGNDSTKWAPNCRNYTNIVYRDVWDGIDIEWYEENGKLEFDFVVQPGADPSLIRMSCEGLTGEMSLDGFGIQDLGFGEKEKVEVATSLPAHTVAPSDPRNDKSNTGKELKLPTSLGELRTALPQVYQISPGSSRSEVDANFKITNKNEFSITLPNGYQKEHTLRIDPLIYSTFLGGSGNEAGQAICADSNGGVIVTGFTNSGNYPIRPGAIQTGYGGNDDCFISHLNSAGSQLLYSTYLGGEGSDIANGITNDGSGGVILTDDTYSTFYPVTTGAYDTTFGGPSFSGTDCFISHLNNDGSQLLYSTYLGGLGMDYGNGICSDGSGGAFVVGSTSSTNFPVTHGAYDTTLRIWDCFITHINATGSHLIYSTALGGSVGEEGLAIIHDDSGGVFVTGYTSSSDFPVTANAFDTSFNGGTTPPIDCFVTHLNSTGSQLIYSTYLGGSGEDAGESITKDGNGTVIVAGGTSSTNFPTTSGAYDSINNGGDDCFITRLNSEGTGLIYSTYLGGTSNEGVDGLVCDSGGSVIITGATSSNDFPVTASAIQTTNRGGVDAFVAKFNNAASQLLYSTYLGSSQTDVGYALVSDGNGGVIVTGQGGPNFPITPSAYDTSWSAGNDVFVTHLNFLIDSTSISERNLVPSFYFLNQNYPNPFNSSTTIEYSLPKPGIVKLEFFDLLGRRISTLINTPQNAGVHHVRFDGKNLASGEYFYRLSAGNFQETRKLLLLK